MADKTKIEWADPTVTIEQRLLATGDFVVDSNGRIWRVRRRGRGCPLCRAENNTGGYLQVRRMVNGFRIHALAHRVVWTHFFGPIPRGLVINHENGIKDDNRPENLKVVTHSENCSHAHRTRLRDQRGEGNPAHKLTDSEVVKIRLAYAQGGMIQQNLADMFGVSHKTISKIVRGERRATAGGPINGKDHRHNACARDPVTGQFIKTDRLLAGVIHDGMPKGS